MAETQTGQRFFAPGSMIWKVDREMVLLLAGGRALLMQLAHPKVAAGVAQHSHFKADPLGRLQRTMSAMWSIVFDDAPQARAALDQVKRTHGNIRGAIQPAEPLPAGTGYDALDTALLLWVHATLIDTALAAYESFVRPLTPDEKSHYYEDTKKLAGLFEIPPTVVPPSLAAFDSYMQQMLGGGAIAVGPTARSLAEDILRPRPLILRPAAPLFSLVTAGLLPAPLRDGYGLPWNERKEKAFTRLSRLIRLLLPLTPPPLRVVRNARHAERTIIRHGG